MSITTRTFSKPQFAIAPTTGGVKFQFGTRGIRIKTATTDTRPTAWIAKDPWQPVAAPSLRVAIYRCRAILCF